MVPLNTMLTLNLTRKLIAVAALSAATLAMQGDWNVAANNDHHLNLQRFDSNGTTDTLRSTHIVASGWAADLAEMGIKPAAALAAAGRKTPPVPETVCQLCFRTVPARGGRVCSGVFQCRRKNRDSCLATQASTIVTCVECKMPVEARKTTWNSLNRFERAKTGGIFGRKYYCINTGDCDHHTEMNRRIRKREQSERKRKQNERKHRNA